MLGAGELVALSLLVFGGIGGGDDPATDRFEPSYHQDLVGLTDVSVDSGWFPMDSPVQLRIFVHAADSIAIEMPGEARYHWSDESIDLVGDVDEGIFSVDVGAQLEACVRFDVVGIQWESEILGPWDFAIVSDATFTPYLLEGNPERPVAIEDETGDVTVASVPIVPDIVIASGNLDIDVSATVSAELAGLRADMATAAGNTAVVDTEGVAAALVSDPGDDPLAASGVLTASLQVRPTIVVRPHLVMSIAGQDFEIVGIDIPVDLPPTDDEIVFDPEPLLFDRPAPAPAPGTGTGDGGGGSGDDTGDAGESGGASQPGDGGSTSGGDTEGSSAGIDELGDGCGCRSDGGRRGAAWLPLVGFVALFRPRRRGRSPRGA